MRNPLIKESKVDESEQVKEKEEEAVVEEDDPHCQHRRHCFPSFSIFFDYFNPFLEIFFTAEEFIHSWDHLNFKCTAALISPSFMIVMQQLVICCSFDLQFSFKLWHHELSYTFYSQVSMAKQPYIKATVVFFNRSYRHHLGEIKCKSIQLDAANRWNYTPPSSKGKKLDLT